MLFRRANGPEKISVGHALLCAFHTQPDVALFDLRFCLVPQPIIEVAIYLVGSPCEFIRRYSPQELDAPIILLESAHESFRQGFRTGLDELDQFESEHKFLLTVVCSERHVCPSPCPSITLTLLHASQPGSVSGPAVVVHHTAHRRTLSV